MQYQLYGGRFTRALIVQMVLAEAGVDYELHEIDILENENLSDEFLRLNPTGQVPVLITPQGIVLTETPAINLYLADTHGLSQFVPAIGEAERGPFLSRLFFLSADLEPILKRYFYPGRYILHAEDEAAMRRKCLDEALQRMGLIEKELQACGPYQLGERFSLLDIILCFWAEYINVDDTLSPLPALRRCLELVRERPQLEPYFDQLLEYRIEYTRLQQAGAGAK